MDFTELHPDTHPELAQPPAGYRPHDLRSMLAEGCRCFGWCRDGRVVSYRWVRPGAVFFRHHRLPLPADCAYAFSAWTDTDFRGRGLAGALAGAIVKRLRAEGFRRLFSCTETQNLAARRYKSRMGGRRLGWMLYMKPPWMPSFMFIAALPDPDLRAWPRLSIHRH